MFATFRMKTSRCSSLLAALLCVLLMACRQAPDGPFPTVTFATPIGQHLTVSLIHHGSLAMTYGETTLQIDPVGAIGDTRIDYSSFGKADAIFVTHEHPDHLSPTTIEALSDGDTRLFFNVAGCRQYAKGDSLQPGQSTVLSMHISAMAVEAYNTTPGRESFHPYHHGYGLVLDFDGLRVYVSGDTEVIPEMADLGPIDVAFLSVNQPYTMTPEQCIQAARLIQPRLLIPYHTGDTNLTPIINALKGSGIEVRTYDTLR